MRVPTLETERLILRAHNAADLSACSAMWADATVVHHIGGTPFSREETWGKMLRYAGLWPLLGYGYWAIEEKATRRFVGELGFADFKREIDPIFATSPEIGWAIAPSAQRRGYATEAVRAAVGWGDENIGHPQTICLIAPENLASIRVAANNDYRESGHLRYRGHLTNVFLRRANAGAQPDSPLA